MYRIIFILSITLFAAPLIADEVSDKAEFKRLYAEFNDLYANSENIDPIIKSGEKLYKLASKIYNKNSQNMAVVTFNLASLYDEKGGETDSGEEKKAFKLYKKYFDILDKLKSPKDKTYLQQYQQYMLTYHNTNKNKATDQISSELLNIAYALNLTNLELANIEYTVAIIRFKHQKFNEIKNSETLLNNALEKFTKEFGSNDKNVLNSEYWLAMIDLEQERFDEAIIRLEKVVEFYSDDLPDQNKISINSDYILHKLYFSRRKIELSEIHYNKYHKLAKKWQGPNIGDTDYLPIVRVAPRYPSRAAQNGIEGYVVITFTVTTEGKTKNVKAIESNHKMFERPAIKAAEKYNYKPRIINDEAVEVKDVKVRVEFRLGYY